MTIWTVEDFFAHQHKHHHHHHHHHRDDDKDGSMVLMAEEESLVEMIAADKHPLEASESWLAFTTRSSAAAEAVPQQHGSSAESLQQQQDEGHTRGRRHRNLKKHRHRHNNNKDDAEYAKKLESKLEDQFWHDYDAQQAQSQVTQQEERRQHGQRVAELYANPGIARQTQHGLMIDAGSTGSRLHVYEWQPRVLRHAPDIQMAVAGNMLSFPGTESRWTDRLQPGLAAFATLADDDELLRAVADYLQPLLDFAKSVLHSKAGQFGEFPIFLRATAGMRILSAPDRARVLNAVRTLFRNETYSPFAFASDEQARVISGEEEAVFDWAGVNFLLGDLLSQSHGAGTVGSPRLTHGALDMGGGSTQISFFEPNEDIMSNLFKLQIGQAKHWNIYAHSFLFYGMNEALDRFYAQLAANKTREQRLIHGITNPCLPHNARLEIRTKIHFNDRGVEMWDYGSEHYPSGNGYFQATLVNEETVNTVDLCLSGVKNLLHLDKNDWCDFAHDGDCSLAGIYQPKLPVGVEFVAFSNYYQVWKFLNLPERATIAQLEEATRHVCSLDHEGLVAFNTHHHSFPEDELDSYCFRSAYTLQLLHHGYGFAANDTIRATNVIHGQKVGWALGAMLYEINTMPWRYAEPEVMNLGVFAVNTGTGKVHLASELVLLVAITLATIFSLLILFVRRERHLRDMYEPVKEVTVKI